MRIGTNKHPFYRVVAVDERKKRTGGYLENLGTYNPLTEPKEVKLNQEKIDQWVKKGAQMSEGFLRIIKKAPQHPPRPPKKEKKADKPQAKPAEELSQDKQAEKTPAPPEPDTIETKEENKE